MGERDYDYGTEGFFLHPFIYCQQKCTYLKTQRKSAEFNVKCAQQQELTLSGLK